MSDCCKTFPDGSFAFSWGQASFTRGWQSFIGCCQSKSDTTWWPQRLKSIIICPLLQASVIICTCSQLSGFWFNYSMDSTKLEDSVCLHFCRHLYFCLLFVIILESIVNWMIELSKTNVQLVSLFACRCFPTSTDAWYRYVATVAPLARAEAGRGRGRGCGRGRRGLRRGVAAGGWEWCAGEATWSR